MTPLGRRAVTKIDLEYKIKNAKSAKVSATFLSSFMEPTSSAIDLLHCGKVTFDSTLQPHLGSKQYIGIGVIGCKIDKLPPKLLRDCSRGAIRIKDSEINEISSGFLHNIDQVLL